MQQSQDRSGAVPRTLISIAFAALNATCALAQPGPPIKFDVPATAFVANTGNLQFVVAEHAKFYERAGLQPNFINTAGGGTALRAFSSSDAPVGIEGVPSALPAIMNGGDYRIVGQTSRQTDNWLVTKSTSGIANITQLRGKKVGVTSPGSTTEQIAKGAIAKAGLAAGDVQIVYLGTVADELVGLEKGLVDAIVSAGQVQLFYHLGTKKDWILLGRGNDFITLIDAVILAKVDMIKSHPEVIRAFLQATRQGRDFIGKQGNSENLVDVVMKWQHITNDELRPAVEQMLADFSRPGRAEAFFGDLSVNTADLEAVARTLVANGTLKQMPLDWSAIVDTSFAPRVGSSAR